ncbi:MAG: type II toxin-antitoxin system HicB family antitoxin [Candidatus Neomarinimicrobiota bacterium]
MKDTLSYKNFIGAIHFSTADDIFFGKIEGVKDLVTFEGRSVDELKAAFIEAVDDYIVLCKEVGKEPLKSAKGSFNVRIPPKLHRQALGRAAQAGVSLNRLVRRAIEREVGRS